MIMNPAPAILLSVFETKFSFMKQIFCIFFHYKPFITHFEIGLDFDHQMPSSCLNLDAL